jgi:hypothetical protein
LIDLEALARDEGFPVLCYAYRCVDGSIVTHIVSRPDPDSIELIDPRARDVLRAYVARLAARLDEIERR